MKAKIIFKLFGEMRFEAENIDDAFKKVSEHFGSLAKGGEGIELLPDTNIKIRPHKVEGVVKLAPCYQCGGDASKCDCSEKIRKKNIDDGICPECGRNLPEPTIEQREGGRSESVTNCPCGAVYTS